MNFCCFNSLLPAWKEPLYCLQPGLLLEANRTTNIRLNQVWWVLDAEPRIPTPPVPLLPPLRMGMSHSVSSLDCPSCSLWLLPFVISVASGEQSLTLTSHLQCQSSPPSFYLLLATVSQVPSTLLHQGYKEDCDTTEEGDSLPTATLMWIFNK